MSLYPLIFQPILKERVWGGTKLKELYGKALSPGSTIGESWEITDRPEDLSIISNGPLVGKDLHWLVLHHPNDLMGQARLQNGRFPLLIKLLDCQQKLSLQVHPPAQKAMQLGGEPKTELWYIAEAAPDAELYVGLKHGVTPQLFQQKIQSGTVADCFHRLPVRAGDAMFLPSGRVHAIGGGLVIFEIQQNSDTTYRVFDWNRLGLDGKPRRLHVAESMASIDFNDFEPGLISQDFDQVGGLKVRTLVDHPLFQVVTLSAATEQKTTLVEPKLRIIGVIDGQVVVKDGTNSVELSRGQFCLIPACLQTTDLCLKPGTTFLKVQPGSADL
jgi:mannose-6-phosphate isomerase